MSEEVLISYIKTIESGLRPVGGVNTEVGEIPSLGGENIVQTGGIKYDPIKLITKEFYDNLNRGKLQEGDVLINKDGANTGKVGIYSPSRFDEAAINEHLFLIRGFPEKISQFYLYYTLLSEEGQKQIFNRITGSAQPGLNANFIQKFKFIPPSLPTQRKIARILSTADAVIEKTQAAIAKYKAIKQGMLHDLFTRGIDPATNKLRPTYEDAPHLYKPSKLGWIPRKWEEKQLLEIVESLSPVTYGIVQPGKFDPNGILLIRGQDYISGWAKEPEFFRVSESLHKQYIRSITRNGDILMCIVGATYGAVSVVPDWIYEANITQTTARIRCEKSTLSPLFLEYYLKSGFGKYFINKYVKGSAQPGLNLGDVDQFTIRFPKNIEEQKLVGKRMKSIDNMIISEQTYLHKLQQIKAGLMADLLSGKKEVHIDEEASN